MTDLLMRRTAVISECGLFRYLLERIWGDEPPLPFCCLNPSRADAEIDDPSATRMMGFSRREKAGGTLLANVHAFRATVPKDMRASIDPFGPDNESYLMMVAAAAAQTGMPLVCAWGASGDMLGGATKAMQIFRTVGCRTVCFGITSNGMPRHPLYVRADQPFEPYP